MKTAKAPNAKVARPVKGKGGIWPWLFVAPLLSGVIGLFAFEGVGVVGGVGRVVAG